MTKYSEATGQRRDGGMQLIHIPLITVRAWFSMLEYNRCENNSIILNGYRFAIKRHAGTSMIPGLRKQPRGIIFLGPTKKHKTPSAAGLQNGNCNTDSSRSSSGNVQFSVKPFGYAQPSNATKFCIYMYVRAYTLYNCANNNTFIVIKIHYTLLCICVYIMNYNCI